MEIDFKTADHIVAVERHIRAKYCKCNSLTVISHLIIFGKTTVAHLKVDQSSQNPQNIEGHQNSLGQITEKKSELY